MKSEESIITQCRITEYPRPMPEGMFDPMPQVWVTFENGEEKMLFEFFPDEIDFLSDDFIGLNESQAYYLRQQKDINYIQS